MSLKSMFSSSTSLGSWLGPHSNATGLVVTTNWRCVDRPETTEDVERSEISMRRGVGVPPAVPAVVHDSRLKRVEQRVSPARVPQRAHFDRPGHGRLLVAGAIQHGAGRPVAVHVNAVCPGAIDTPALQGPSGEQRAELAARNPLGRMDEPAEVAQTVLYLASHESSLTTRALFP